MQSGGTVSEFLRRHRPTVVLVALILACTTFPLLAIHFVIGDAWQGIMPAFTDEGVYYAHLHALEQGYLTDGNPFFLEHRNGPPLVIFGGAWINALPLFAGVPFNIAMILNFVIWSLAFALMLYYLFRMWAVPVWIAVVGTVAIYLQSFAHVWRAVNLQPVYPFYFLFYVALARLIKEQSRRNIALLAGAVAISFYVFAYLWQIAVITLGLLLLWALVRKNWSLMRATLISSFIGGIVGLPIPLYMLVWLPSWSPYFWESMGRLGLVNSHVPMAEIIYSGGWIGIVLVLLGVLVWRARGLREDKEFGMLAIFLATSGLGLWIMQGSNAITGKLLETGEHVKTLILPWLAFATVLLGAFLWRERGRLTKGMRSFSLLVVLVCSLASLYYLYYYFVPFVNIEEKREMWLTQQMYAGPFAWLDQAEVHPVVVWSDPSDGLASTLPTFTKHFTLYTSAGLSTLVAEGEIRERFLISQYFARPTVADLESDTIMSLYLGRHDFPHQAKTIEREVKVCRLLFFWDKQRRCGTIPTPQSLLGDVFFQGLEKKFRTDIVPNIKAYLAKYHVAYILKDTLLNPEYRPEQLGAVRVYVDGRFEIYRLP